MDVDILGNEESRRNFVSTVTLFGTGLMLRGGNAEAEQAAPAHGKSRPSDVNATEDLMREHGVLNRVLLIYEEGVRRIEAGTLPSTDAL